MKTSAVNAADLARSVIAVPPLARSGDLALNPEANATLIRHMEAGGVSTMMYGGNANFYNIGMYEYAAVLDFLEQTVDAGYMAHPLGWPRFRQAHGSGAVLRTRAFPDRDGAASDVSRYTGGQRKSDQLFAESYGRPVIVYVKAENYLLPVHIKRLVEAGLVAAIKYAVVREDPAADPFLQGAARQCRCQAGRQRHRRAARGGAFANLRTRGVHVRIGLRRSTWIDADAGSAQERRFCGRKRHSRGVSAARESSATRIRRFACCTTR